MPLAAYLRHIRSIAADGAAPADILASLTSVLGAHAGIDLELDHAAHAPIDVADLAPPVPLRQPSLLGQVHEALLDPIVRRRAGAHYTPVAVAAGLVDFALDGTDAHAVHAVCDPAVGGGAFLLAVAGALQARGVSTSTVVRHCCFGIDVDPLAVAVSRASLALWAGEPVPELAEHLVVGDALAEHHWPQRFALVVGNPPFQNQLERATVRSRAHAAALQARYGTAARGYVDTAALFLLRGLELAAPGGCVALVQPHSTLGARHTTALRAAVLERAALRGVWFATEPVFRAGVRVWAPVLETPGPHRDGAPIARRTGAGFARAAEARPARRDLATTWGAVVADLAGTPVVRLASAGRVRDLATATAGFRDQFYGLVGAVDEAAAHDDAPRLVTSGLIDVLCCQWGMQSAQFNGARHQRPVVRLERVAPAIADWVRAQLRPKVLVATQTRVVEAAVDATGRCVPSTPVIAVHAPADQLWHLAAALSAPPVTAHALGLSAGAALSLGAVKLSARQVLDLPLPVDRAAWDRGAELAQLAAGEGRDRALEAFAPVMCSAYGVEADPLAAWWLERIRRRETRPRMAQ